MLNLFDFAYEDNVPLSQKVSFLESACHFSSFCDPDAKSLDEVNAKIKICLGSQVKSFEGLVLLKQVIEQCSEEVFTANAISWAHLTLKILQNSGESSGSRKFACKVMSSILQNVQSVQSICKKTSIQILPGILETILSVSIDDEWVEYAVACLAVCLRYFPGPCGLKQDKIQYLLILLLDSWDRRAFEPLALCFCYLPTCYVPGINQAGSNSFWTEQLKLFIGTLHSILNSIVIGTGIKEVIFSRIIPFDSLPENPFSCALKQASRFKAVGQCLARMLVTKIHHKVAVPLDALLNILSRTFSITSADFVCNPFILSMIPVLHLTALTILESLLLSCDQYLLYAFRQVGNLLIQVLKANEYNNMSGLQSQFSVVRCATYHVFQAYIKKLKFNGPVSLNDNYLTSMMIKDMKPNGSDTIKSVSTLALKTCAMDFVAPDGKRRIRYCIKTCIEALRALKAFVSFGSQCSEIHKDIYNAVIAAVLQIQQNPLDLFLPYNDEICRAELYSLLRIASTKLYCHQRSLLHLSLALISSTLEDSSTMVSQVCREEFNTLNVIVRSCKDLMPENKMMTSDLKDLSLRNKTIIIESIGTMVNDEMAQNCIATVPVVTEEHNDDYDINADDSASHDSMKSEEMNSSDDDITEEHLSPTKPSEDKSFDSSNYFPMNNEHYDHSQQNGLLSEGNTSDHKHSRKRHFSNSSSEFSPCKKIAENDIEEEESDVTSMIRDFAPTSPDNNAV